MPKHKVELEAAEHEAKAAERNAARIEQGLAPLEKAYPASRYGNATGIY